MLLASFESMRPEPMLGMEMRLWLISTHGSD